MDSLASKGNVTIKNSESASDTKDRDGNGHGKNTPTADEDGLHHIDFSAGSLTVIFNSISKLRHLELYFALHVQGCDVGVEIAFSEFS